MRPIKFRAWGEEARKMFFMDGLSGSFFLFDGDESLKLHPGVPVMQFTGLTDKNGKEIYEGDVVMWHNEHVATICWNDIATPHWSGLPDTTVDGQRDCEVIGNIYENPDLLKP